jgi:hypothetical protein
MIDLPAPVSPVRAVRPGPDREVQGLDQDHVANAQADQHGRKMAANPIGLNGEALPITSSAA